MEIKGIINIDMTGEEMEAALRRALTLPCGIMLTTYAELVAARDAGELIPGQFYQITDYVTRVKAELSDVRSAGHPFDIIVLATSSTLLLEQAWATQHDGDTYFDGHNLQAWQLRYTQRRQPSGVGRHDRRPRHHRVDARRERQRVQL